MPKSSVSTPTPPAPLYQGSVNTWECDDGGHLNVRFQMERAMVGLAHMARALEMPRAFTPAAGSTLTLLEAHVRFLREARPGAPLIMHGGVLAIGESDATFLFDMRHADGAPASAFTLRVAHTDTRGFRPCAWSSRSRDAAKGLKCALPAHAKPRSIDMTRTPGDARLARAHALGAHRIGAAVVAPDQCDAFGRLRGEHMIGRVSDSVPNLLLSWRQALAEAAAADGVETNPAGAVVEARMLFRAWPRAGDLIEVYSGAVELGDKTMRLAHWLCDPERGGAWASFEVMALTFDTLTRKTMTSGQAARARAEALLVKDWGI